MTELTSPYPWTDTPPMDVDLDITVRTSAGSGRTLLAAFDDALMSAGAGNFNLVPLSSVIPAQSTVRRASGPLPGRHGDRLYCVMARAWAEHPGETAWCGLGWVRAEDGRGLFVEHHGGSAAMVVEQIHLSLGDMCARREEDFGTIEHVVASVHCVDRPVCALALAAYQVTSWKPL